MNKRARPQNHPDGSVSEVTAQKVKVERQNKDYAHMSRDLSIRK